MKAILALCLLLVVSSAYAASWAVLVAGSNTWGNYRHQADICHAYQIAHKNGIPDERIIVMMYDDLATNRQNPFPGQVYNKPTAAGEAGVDVYAGCPKDYTGQTVTAANFLAVLSGNKTAATPKVVESGPNDNIFVFYSDHGSVGLIAMPVGPYLYNGPLIETLQYMHRNNRYSKLVFYLEACESGSMFEDILPADINVYATTAANARESSWGWYCPPQDSVNGKRMNSCLGDEYSISWMEIADEQGPAQTLGAQFDQIKARVQKSHVMSYGDLSFLSEPTGCYQGECSKVAATPAKPMSDDEKRLAGGVDSRDIPVHLAYYRYIRADRNNLAEYHAAAAELHQEIEKRTKADKFFHALAERVVGKPNAASLLQAPGMTGVCGKCCEQAHEYFRTHCGGYDDYSMKYAKVVTNMCMMQKNVDASRSIISAMSTMCKA